MQEYDPELGPDPEAWLAADESERIHLVLAFHHEAKVRLPNAMAHATIHVIVENQVAEGDAIPVRGTPTRLQAEGLDRHDAIHAVGAVLNRHLLELMKEGDRGRDPNVAYWAELEDLSAEGWRRSR